MSETEAEQGAAGTAPPPSANGEDTGKHLPVAPKPPPGPRIVGRGSAASQFGGELGAVIKAARDKYSPNVLRPATSKAVSFKRIRTGIFVLDLALGGGVRRSAGCMFYGEKSSGKSTTSLLTVAAALRAEPDKRAVYLDVEGTFDAKWASKLGVDLERLLIVEPETGEHAVDLADGLLRAQEVSVLVVDSIAMLTPMKEIEGSAEDSLPGIHARLIGNFLRRVTNGILTERHRGHHPCVLYINQFRLKIGVVFGDPRTLPGGKALEFATSQQVLMSNKEHKIDKGDDSGLVDYNEHSFQITKDKTGGRIKEGKFKLIRDALTTGLPEAYIDQIKTVMTVAERAGLCESFTGGVYDIPEHGRMKGIEKVREYFDTRPEAYDAFQIKILDHYRQRWEIS